MKPRISRWRDGRYRWACSGVVAVGFGVTPREAYGDWLRKTIERLEE